MVSNNQKQDPKKMVSAQSKKNDESMAVQITQWVGTPKSIILHSLFFVGIFSLKFLGIETENILLILTTLVSLEAIYLSIFIQMSININTRSLKAVEEDVDELQKDVEGIEDDVEEISEDIDKIQADEDDEDFEKNATKLIEKMEVQMQTIINELNALKQKKAQQ